MSYLLLFDPTDQTVSNTAAETTLFSTTLPAGVLSDHRCLLIEHTAKWRVENASGRKYTVRLKYGGVTVFAAASPGSGKTTLYHASWQRYLIQATGTAAQKAVGVLGFGGPGSDTGGFGTVATPSDYGTNATTVDFNVNQPIVFTVQLSTANASHIYTSQGIWVFLLNEPFYWKRTQDTLSRM